MAKRGRPPKTGQKLGPSEIVLAGVVARRYYLDERSKVQIAEELGLSRFQVTRILGRARSEGWIRIEINLPGHIDDALSLAVQRELGVRRAIVVDAPEASGAAVREELGSVIAGVLGELVQPRQVLGLTWSRTIEAMVRQLNDLPVCTVTQLAGSITVPGATSGTVEVVRSVAALSGGEALPIYAPLVVEDAATAAALRRQPEIARALDRANDLDVAVVSVGSWAPDGSTVWDAVSGPEREAALAGGAVAECSGRLIDGEGRDVPGGFDDRVVALTMDQLRGTPEVIATVYGAHRAAAARAAVRGGLVGTLVVDTALARALFD